MSLSREGVLGLGLGFAFEFRTGVGDLAGVESLKLSDEGGDDFVAGLRDGGWAWGLVGLSNVFIDAGLCRGHFRVDAILHGPGECDRVAL